MTESGRAAAPAATAGRTMRLPELEQLLRSSSAVADSWHPWIIDLSAGDFGALAALCRTRNLTLVDEIGRQLEDLALVRLPGGTAAARARFIAEAVGAEVEPQLVGRWIYIPWRATVVHLLGPEAYFEVITNRNQHKITREEQRRLRTKRIGVLGLSVGGEAAFAVAQEHLCGEIVLADFDRLDLSNLNRLGAGIDDLGQNKAILVARRIAMMDPYLTVRLYPEGIGEDNLDAFLDGLDLLIEECDGLAIKYEVRRRARDRRLNVVFAADERGFLSVEPYADWPELEPFHGALDGPQAPREAYPTPLAFMRALTEWMGGWDAVSQRSRRSLEQLGMLTCGYPQLASEARLAAGQIGHVARRLLLGERVRPYMGNMDLDAMLATVSPDRTSFA